MSEAGQIALRSDSDDTGVLAMPFRREMGEQRLNELLSQIALWSPAGSPFYAISHTASLRDMTSGAIELTILPDELRYSYKTEKSELEEPVKKYLGTIPIINEVVEVLCGWRIEVHVYINEWEPDQEKAIIGGFFKLEEEFPTHRFYYHPNENAKFELSNIQGLSRVVYEKRV